MPAQDAAAVGVEDVNIPDGTILHLHEHALTIVDAAVMHPHTAAGVFGAAGAFACGSCRRITYDYGAGCLRCNVFFCGPCVLRHQDEQARVLNEILDLRHGSGSPNHRQVEQRSRRLRASVAVDTNRQLPLVFSCCIRGDLPTLRDLVDKSCFAGNLDLDECCEVGEYKGATLLIIAAQLGMRDIVELLLSRGASHGAIDVRGMTALMHAAYGGHADVVDELVFAGAVVDRAAYCGYTALLFAATRGHAVCLERLVAGGAKLSVRNPMGRNAVIIAALNGHIAAVRYLSTLVPHRDLFVLRDLEGYSALDAAVAMRHSAVERCLRDLRTGVEI